MERIKGEAIADAHEVIAYLTKVMRGQSEAEIVVVEGTGDGHSRATKIQKAPDEKERLRAAEILSKYHGLLDTKTKQEVGVTIHFSGENELQ